MYQDCVRCRPYTEFNRVIYGVYFKKEIGITCLSGKGANHRCLFTCAVDNIQEE